MQIITNRITWPTSSCFKHAFLIEFLANKQELLLHRKGVCERTNNNRTEQCLIWGVPQITVAGKAVRLLTRSIRLSCYRPER